MATKTDEEWQGVLRRINTQVNKYPYGSIPADQNERISIEGYGDCRSYAYEKFEQMLEAGFPADRLSFCSCETETGEAHAVLLVQFGRELWCADNRNSWVDDFRQSRRYRWDWIPRFLIDLIEAAGK